MIWKVVGLLAVTLQLILAGTACGQNTSDSSGTVEVVVSGLKPKQGGVVIVALYRGPESWLELDSAFARQSPPVTADTVAVVFTDIPFDSSYAIQVLHDKNENGKFDMRWFPFPKPKEGAGVSNDAVRRGPPKYDQARLAIHDSVTTIRIPMHY
jgi:uncharacterized protein (DUF2141 family)